MCEEFPLLGLFQSALPLRGATWRLRPKADVRRRISIRAPLAGSDDNLVSLCDLCHKFQSALPLRGATTTASPFKSSTRFQSALPLRGATCIHSTGQPLPFISIRAPLAGSDVSAHLDAVGAPDISIRAPLAGSDGLRYKSRFPTGEISIRAPLAGSDRRAVRGERMQCNFNPRSPCGERRRTKCHGRIAP